MAKFIKGQSGNPKGAPKKEHSITQTIKDMMDENPEVKRELGEKILTMAKRGDIVAIKTLWNYIDGMPKQDIKMDATVEVTFHGSLKQDE